MEAIGTLAGGIAHDFNNILAILMNCLSLIEPEVPHESKALGYVQLSHDALQRAKNLVQQILAFSRQDDQVRTPVQMPRLLNETLALLRSSLPTTIDMQQHISEEDGTILGDATQMHQIMLNLCTNAAHAMRDTGGILEVRLETTRVDDALVAHHPALQPGLHAHVTVRDTWTWHGTRRPGAHLRSLLYHQRRWRRNRHGACHGAWHCRQSSGGDYG